MGQFNSGVWILGLSIYFFVFGLIIYSVMGANSYYGYSNIGISYSGINALNTQQKYESNCTGTVTYLSCSANNMNDNTSCSSINGCSWDNTNLFGNCDGVLVNKLCSDYNASQCNLIDGCTFIDSSTSNKNYFNYEDGLSWSNMKTVLGSMSGFKSNFNAPSSIKFIISFFLFWIPLLIFIWSVYMAIPFLH